MKIMCPFNTLKMSSHTFYLLALPEKSFFFGANSCKLAKKINNQNNKEKRKKFDDFEKKKSPQLGTQREETLHFV